MLASLPANLSWARLGMTPGRLGLVTDLPGTVGSRDSKVQAVLIADVNAPGVLLVPGREHVLVPLTAEHPIARLLQASPDLLEATRGLLSVVQEMRQGHGDEDAWRDIEAMARDALQKALTPTGSA